MVAPHNTGDLIRSLIRVPGSGLDKTAGSEFLDLGRTSSLAARVPVPRTLPPALGPRKEEQQMVNGNDCSQSREVTVNLNITLTVNDRKRKIPEEYKTDNHDSSATIKRVRVQQIENQADIPPLPLIPLQLSVVSNDDIAHQLIEERKKLMLENQQLQRRVRLFQDVFRDKKLLGSIAKRMGVTLS